VPNPACTDSFSAPTAADREETDASGNVRTPASLFMDGPQIFNFANRVVPETVEKVLAAGRLGRGDIDLFVFHQANRYLLEHLQRKLAIPRERFVIDVEHTGNTVSSSIPLAIDRARHAGVLRAGMRVMLVGFGVGYSWGGCIWETAND
jgi:3-oxoacyl-[acyl-carrier-protein] synthase III